MTNEELQEMATSIKYGFCQSMAEHGFSPSELETILQKEASNPVGVFTGLSAAKNFISPLLMAGLGIGAVAGVGTAALRHKLDTMAEGTEDKKMREQRMKIDFYKKMIHDLKTDMAAAN